ncbi:MAG: hypothetical protein D6765_06115 [Bacteroidetes bacterium]|nr:MAG: hypothetical protein D6765_06115 [Bacteroidota bacterium]
MKALSLICTLCLCGLLSGQSSEFSADEQAIVNTIAQETQGWWERDFDKWSDAWAHKDYVYWSGTTNVLHVEVEGWKALKKYARENFEKYPEPNQTPVDREDWKFRIYGNAAWVRFTQISDGISKETRILEKINGKWKIVHVGWINATSFEETRQAESNNP